MGKTIQIMIDKRGAVTNGDVIKAMFPNIRIIDMSEVGVVQLVWEGVDVFLGESRNFSCDWWNSPYKESDKNETN